MPWMRIEVWHGPGHQAITEEFVWFKEDNKWEQDCWLGNFISDMECPVVKAFRKVQKLPKKVREQMISREESRIRNAKYMLDILKKTPERKRNRPKVSRAVYLSQVKFKAGMRKWDPLTKETQWTKQT